MSRQPGAASAAGQEGPQLRVHPPPRVQHPRPRDAEHLVPGEHREVAAELAHVDRDVPRALGAVEAQPDRRAEPPPQLLQRGQPAEHVVHVGHGDQLGPRRHLGGDVGGIRLAGLSHSVRDQRDPPAEPGQHLPQVHPGVDVRGVVVRAVQDLVPVGQIGQAPGQRHGVQPRGGPGREHDFLRARGAEEPGRLLADLGDPPCRAGRPRIRATPGVGGLAGQRRGDRVDDRLRLLRGGGAVQVDDPGIGGQRRELLPRQRRDRLGAGGRARHDGSTGRRGRG